MSRMRGKHARFSVNGSSRRPWLKVEELTCSSDPILGLSPY